MEVRTENRKQSLVAQVKVENLIRTGLRVSQSIFTCAGIPASTDDKPSSKGQTFGKPFLLRTDPVSPASIPFLKATDVNVNAVQNEKPLTQLIVNCPTAN